MALDPVVALAPPRAGSADEAIALVLRSERSAHEAIAQAQVEALHLEEAARADARAVAARAERHARRAVAAFEHARQSGTARLNAAAAAMAQTPELTPQDRAALARAVTALAAELSGGRP